MKTLVAGWFSFEGMNTSAGDLLARDLACDWLDAAGRPYDVALAAPYRRPGSVDWRSVDPPAYDDVVFVCGPFRDNPITAEFLGRFKGRRMIGLNLSMLDPLDAWNPFDLLFERDSTAASRPDITFLSAGPLVPVVGVVLVHPQPQYKSRAMHAEAHAMIRRLLASREVAAVPIDTCLEGNAVGLRTPAEVESLIARVDVVVTTRLHGTVLALKNGVPPLAVDPIAGGAKIASQAAAIGWPVVFTADVLTEGRLREAFEYCLTEAARAEARECRDRASRMVRDLRDDFIRALRAPASG